MCEPFLCAIWDVDSYLGISLDLATLGNSPCGILVNPDVAGVLLPPGSQVPSFARDFGYVWSWYDPVPSPIRWSSRPDGPVHSVLCPNGEVDLCISLLTGPAICVTWEADQISSVLVSGFPESCCSNISEDEEPFLLTLDETSYSFEERDDYQDDKLMEILSKG